MAREYGDLQPAMTRMETGLGLAYLAIHQLVLPLLLSAANGFLGMPLSLGKLNFVYFFLNFAAIIAIFHRFLRESFTRIRLGSFFRAVLLGLLFYYTAGNIVTAGILRLDPSFSNVNDAGISQILREDFLLMGAGTVFLVPTVEETLFRGLIFRGLWKKSRIAAYCVSAAAFAAIHVAGYLGMYSPRTLALCFLQYIPAGVGLAWAYTAAGTVFAPIAMHTVINALGILAMR